MDLRLWLILFLVVPSSFVCRVVTIATELHNTRLNNICRRSNPNLPSEATSLGHAAISGCIATRSGVSNSLTMSAILDIENNEKNTVDIENNEKNTVDIENNEGATFHYAQYCRHLTAVHLPRLFTGLQLLHRVYLLANVTNLVHADVCHKPCPRRCLSQTLSTLVFVTNLVHTYAGT
uniref:Uncharacterized protein n=1 Tax=Timema bartmani TaxID=61472 RepID=A0A7R9I6G6_9NEOP|nr:unnamed protein product [Timema bartmani]